MKTPAGVALEQDEVILVLAREHKVILIFKLAVWGLIAILPFVFEVLINLYFPILLDEPTNIFWQVIKAVFFLNALLGLLIIVTLYYLNVHIVTNKRVLDADQRSVIHHQTTEAHLNKIQDVSADIKGFWRQIFNYGDVHIQSAGDIERIVFESVSDPQEIRRIISDLHKQLQ